MPQVKFTTHLKRYFPELQQLTEVQGNTMAEIIANLDKHYPGIASYIVNERGTLRKHVNIFIGDELIYDRQKLQDQVKSDDHIFIFQALSGG